MSDAQYFAARAAKERGMAERATIPQAQAAHYELAELHAGRASLFQGHETGLHTRKLEQQ